MNILIVSVANSELPILFESEKWPERWTEFLGWLNTAGDNGVFPMTKDEFVHVFTRRHVVHVSFKNENTLKSKE